MTKLVFLAPCALLTLAACSSEPEVDPIAAEDVAATAESLNKPVPGLYSMKVEVQNFEISNLPEDATKQLEGQFSGLFAQAGETCITQEKADEGFEKSIRELGEGSNGLSCNFTEFNAEGAKLNAALSCSGPQGISATMTMDGTIEPEKQVIDNAVKMNAPMLMGREVNVQLKSTMERTGDCAGG